MESVSITNEIWHGGCMDLFASIPDSSVDLTFADPPFNLNKKYSTYLDAVGEGAYIRWSQAWIAEMVRVTKPTGFIVIHNIPKWLVKYGWILDLMADFLHWVTWDAPTKPMGNTLQPAHYGFLLYAKDKKQAKIHELRYPHKRCRKSGILEKDYGGKKSGLHPFGPLLSDVWTDLHRIKHNKYRDPHPCQLPIPLMERIILLCTNAGDMVLDPFSGTGTTAVAAKRLGRCSIGFDVDEDYVQIGRDHLAQEIAGVSRLGKSFVSVSCGKIRTIRDSDWPDLAQYFILPDDPKEIDQKEISLRSHKVVGDMILPVKKGK